MVLSILQLILVFRIDLKFLLHLILLILLSVFPNTSCPLCKCDISSGTKSCIFLCGNTKPLLAGSPPILRPSQKSFCLPYPHAAPAETWFRSVSHSARQKARSQAQRSCQQEHTGGQLPAASPRHMHCHGQPPWDGVRAVGAEAVRRTDLNTVTHTHAAHRFLRRWPLSRLNSEESSRRKDTRHRGLAWRGRCRPRADGSGRPGLSQSNPHTYFTSGP